MQMYAVHQEAILLPVKFESPLYTFKDESLPAISVSASKDANGLTQISLVNIDANKENKAEIDLKELGTKNITAKILTSKKMQDYNSFDNPSKVHPIDYKGFKIEKGKLIVTIPQFSVVMLELE
jgi:alpha-N-arabinofuranosidase